MEEKLLFICKTPFQVITSLLIKLNDAPRTEADMIILKNFTGAEELSVKCQKINMFKNVACVSCDKKNLLAGNVFPSIMLRNAAFCKTEHYKRIYLHGRYDDFNNAVYYFHPNAEIVIYDEGYSSYTEQFLQGTENFSKCHRIVWNLMECVFRRKFIDKHVKMHYLYDPRLCIHEMPYPVKKIWDKDPVIGSELIEKVNCIFDTGKHIDEYNKKYIFFEECFASDFNNNGDLRIIDSVINLVGNDNFMVKLHPRDKTNRFEQLGIHTNLTQGIPAEALIPQLTNKIFITYTSGSVLNYKFLCDRNIKTIVLYKLIPDGFVKLSNDQIKWFDKFISLYPESFFAPSTFEELQSIIKDLKNKNDR